jgi:hypothetical protein
MTHTSVTKQDWTTSRAEVLADRVARNKPGLESPGFMPDMPGMDHSGHIMPAMTAPDAYAPFNRLVPVASTLGLAFPVEIMPAVKAGGTWTIKSDAHNRTLRDVVQADPKTGEVISRKKLQSGDDA